MHILHRSSTRRDTFTFSKFAPSPASYRIIATLGVLQEAGRMSNARTMQCRLKDGANIKKERKEGRLCIMHAITLHHATPDVEYA